jgi:uroporphyrinogen-III decarboxylase
MPTMTSRERMLTAISNGRPDRLPCQVHNWMGYYLKTYLDGCDVYQAYERFGMDFAVYVSPIYRYDERDLANWQMRRINLGTDASGNPTWMIHIETPMGALQSRHAANTMTEWTLEHLIKTPHDFEIWDTYYPVPTGADFTPIREAHERVGDRGIVRTFPFSPGQGSPWQSFCTLMGTEESIYLAMDEPEFMHAALQAILEKTLCATALWGNVTAADLVETGGGAGSNTVISPDFFRQFCLPYDQVQHAALHEAGVKIVYHLCGGLMQMLDLVVENGADGLETMTPPSMGGDCDLREASRRVGDRLFFVGGFDQNAGFEHGTPAEARRLVMECFEATKDHAGYIVSPSDHFFAGAPENLQAFVDAARECVY